MKLIYPPEITLEILDQKTLPDSGFLKILRSNVKAHYDDGSISEPFTVDSVLRSKLDAVVIIGHFYGDMDNGYPQEGRYVYLRSAIRPALMLRDYSSSKLLEDEYVGNLYELPAGLVEPDEVGQLGLQKAAAREFEEEVGFTVKPESMKLLGHRIWPAVGLAGERIFFYEVGVNPREQKLPSLDGSPMEKGGIVVPVLLREAIDSIKKGYLPDAKTEIGLRRLADKFVL